MSCQAAPDLFRRVIRLLRSGDPEAAGLLAELERFPEYGPGWLALGEVLDQAGHRGAALSALGRAARAQPPSSVAAQRLGQCLADSGRYADAIAAFQRAVGIDPVFARGWYSLGLAQQDGGAHDAAAHSYRSALRIQPDFQEAALNLGVVLQEAGEMQAALDAYALALRLRADSIGRIAQALASGRSGIIWLDPGKLRLALAERHPVGCP